MPYVEHLSHNFRGALHLLDCVYPMKKDILIIDDSSSLRQVVNLTLSASGYQVKEAENGQDALDKLKDYRPKLILCDVNMPVMDGITFLQEVRGIDHCKFTPILMLTTESENDIREKGKQAGAKAWLTKPFKPDQVLKAVAKLTL